MEILSHFLTFPGQITFDLRGKTPCEAQSMEPLPRFLRR